jgi:hypothetical protein
MRLLSELSGSAGVAYMLYHIGRRHHSLCSEIALSEHCVETAVALTNNVLAASSPQAHAISLLSGHAGPPHPVCVLSSSFESVVFFGVPLRRTGCRWVDPPTYLIPNLTFDLLLYNRGPRDFSPRP